MKLTLVFRLNSCDTIEVEQKVLNMVPLPYYVDILNEKDIEYYLINKDLSFFIDKFIFINNKDYYLKSFLIDFKYYLKIDKNEVINYILSEFDDPYSVHEDIIPYEMEIPKANICFCFDTIPLSNSIENIFVKNFNDFVDKIFHINKLNYYYFIQKNNKIYLKFLLYKFDIKYEVKDITHVLHELDDDIESFIYNNLFYQSLL